MNKERKSLFSQLKKLAVINFVFKKNCSSMKVLFTIEEIRVFYKADQYLL